MNISRPTGSRRLAPSLAALLAAALLSPVAASAQDDWYVRAIGGLSWLGDSDGNDFSDDAGRQDADGSWDFGYIAGLSAGRWFGERWRADLEWAYRSNDNDKVKLDDGRVSDDGNFASSALSTSTWRAAISTAGTRTWKTTGSACSSWAGSPTASPSGSAGTRRFAGCTSARPTWRPARTSRWRASTTTR